VSPRSRLSAALAVVVLSAAFAAAAPDRPGNPDTFVYLLSRDAGGVDPGRADDVFSLHLERAIYDTLVALKPGSSTEYEPRLSTTVPSVFNGLVTDNGLAWRFPIRPGVRFHDGAVLGPEDVRYSLIRLLVLGAVEGKYDSLRLALLGTDAPPAKGDEPEDVLRRAQAAVTTDGGDVVLHLPRRCAFLLAKLAGYGFVVSKSWAMLQGDWDGTAAGLPNLIGPGAPDALMDRADGTGPFRLEHWDRVSRELVLLRNDGYWRGPARLRRVVVKTVPELTDRVRKLRSGEADLIAAWAADETEVRDIPGVVVSTGLQASVRWPILDFNFRVAAAGSLDLGSGRLDGEGIPAAFFSDRDVRLAFAQAFDAGAFIAGFLRGRGRPASGVIPPGVPGYASSGLAVAHDRRLAEAHFRAAWGGRVWDRGFKFSIPVVRGSEMRLAVVKILKAELLAINPKFRVEARLMDWPAYREQWTKGGAAIAFGGTSSPVPDPIDYLRAQYHSRGGNARVMGYRNPEVDRLIDAADAETDPRMRLALIDRAQRLAADDVPLVVLAEPQGDALRVSRAWVQGYHFSPYFPGAPETSDYEELWKE
jgi:peptide/nickel transport system substrate-binding protein